jgi:hypothetical protein
MPYPVPAGALAKAYREMCVRCVRNIKWADYEYHMCDFTNDASKKCSYCIGQNAACVPVGVRMGSYRDMAN